MRKFVEMENCEGKTIERVGMSAGHEDLFLTFTDGTFTVVNSYVDHDNWPRIRFHDSCDIGDSSVDWVELGICTQEELDAHCEEEEKVRKELIEKKEFEIYTTLKAKYGQS